MGSGEGAATGLRFSRRSAEKRRMAEETISWQRMIASYVPPSAYAPRTRAALEGLGYRVVPVATRGRFMDDSWEPDLRIVDERYVDRVPPEDYLPRTPMVLLTGATPRRFSDCRVVGTVPRPAALASLFPLLQSALENTPRRTARAQTQLPGRCTYDNRRSMGAVVCLSEGGCLFRTREPMAADQPITLLFPLPLGTMISTRAHVIDQRGECVALAFDSAEPPVREAVAKYVAQRLATASA
jgi:hypothetical protein